MGSLKLYPEQREAVEALKSYFLEKKLDKGLLVYATGGGKSITMATFAQEALAKGYKCLWIVHRDQLVAQAAATFKKISPDYKTSIWNADSKDTSGDVVITMVLSQKGLVEALIATGSKYWIMIDEGHHASEEAGSYLKLYEALKKCGIVEFIAGCTATPTRLDGEKLIFTNVVYQMSFLEAVKKAYLAKPDFREVKTAQNYRLEHRGGDFTAKSLKQLDNKSRNDLIAKIYKDNKSEFGKTIIFAVNIEHCKTLTAAIMKADSSADVRYMTYETPDEDRTRFIQWFSEGGCDAQKVLINVTIASEGYDEPTIRTVILARPTMSEVLWAQMVGRASRIVRDESGNVIKPTFLLVNISDDIAKYGLLCREWQLKLRDPTAEEILVREEEDAQSKLSDKLKKLGIKADFDGIKAIDIKAVLIVSSKFKKGKPIILNQEQLYCLWLLENYIDNYCLKRGHSPWGEPRSEFNFDAFQTSYTQCVPSGEFEEKEWRDISWAYYWDRIRSMDKVYCLETSRKEKCWDYIPVEAYDWEPDKVQLAKALEIIQQENEEFNQKYGSSEGCKLLIEEVQKHLDSLGIDVSKFLKRSTEITCRDKMIIIRIGNKTLSPWDLRDLGRANKSGTEFIRDYLDTNSASWRISPKAK